MQSLNSRAELGASRLKTPPLAPALLGTVHSSVCSPTSGLIAAAHKIPVFAGQRKSAGLTTSYVSK